MFEAPKNDNSRKKDRTVCAYHKTCSGCHYWDTPWVQQKDLKIKDLKQLLHRFGLRLNQDIQYVEIAPWGLRDRLDFTFENSKLGLYSGFDPQVEKSIVDLPECLQLSPPLQSWLTEFRKIRWPLEKASFRLRVSPKGDRGLWIDCANIDIKKLLDEKSILLELQKICFVEMGQRRKTPKLVDGQFKLFDPQGHPWFETWLDDQTVLPLYCQVASFTQPSLRANKVLCHLIRNLIQKKRAGSIIEFGSGIGNLTFPAAVYADSLLACEVDPLALAGLERTLQELPSSWSELKSKIKLHTGDFQRKFQSDFSNFQTALANPPRSGLMNFLDPLESLESFQRPSQFIYMSCFPESLCVDLKRLQDMEYQIQDVILLDQFPQSLHYEVLCYLQK